MLPAPSPAPLPSRLARPEALAFGAQKDLRILSALVGLVALASAGLACEAQAQLIGPDSTLQGQSMGFLTGVGCAAGVAWSNGMCGSSGGTSTAPAPAPVPAPAPAVTNASCGAQTLAWNQYQGAWNGNNALGGTYTCQGYSNGASHGSSVNLSNAVTGRTGTASVSCNNGSWQLNNGACDGVTKPTVTQIAVYSSNDSVRIDIMSCYKQFLYRPMTYEEKNYYEGFVNSSNAQQTCNSIATSQEARQAANFQHIIQSSEDNLCGSGYGYPWATNVQGNTCKARP